MGKLVAPALIVLAVAMLILGAWWYLGESKTGGSGRHELLDSMEAKGIPDFTLPTPEGEKVRFSSIKSELVLINFWASWCEPCVEEFPSMMKLAEHMGGRLKLVAISEDQSKEDMLAFLRAFDVQGEKNLILLWDGDRKVAEQFGTDRLPESYIVDSSGRLIRKVAGTLNWMEPSVVSYIESLATPKATNDELSGAEHPPID